MYSMNRNLKAFKKLVSHKNYKHLKRLENYACMSYDLLVNIERRLNHNLSHNIGSNIRNAVEYAKVTYCKILQCGGFDIDSSKYSDNIKPDIDVLYKLLPTEDYKILLKHYKDLEDYEYNNKRIRINDNIFLR